jgi:hypothetical protein
MSVATSFSESFSIFLPSLPDCLSHLLAFLFFLLHEKWERFAWFEMVIAHSWVQYYLSNCISRCRMRSFMTSMTLSMFD